jgi:endonuclease YncB( thermonuclease family)
MAACSIMSTFKSAPPAAAASQKKRAVLFAWLAVIAALVALLSVLAVVDHEESPKFPGQVTRIVDADTIEVRLNTGPIRVRLHAIDAPELDQPWGPEATRALSKMILGKNVALEPLEEDQDHRIVATVFLGKVDVNADLVRLGHAWAFRPQMTKADEQLCDLEGEARAARRGLWSLPLDQTEAPWDWRRTTLKSVKHYSSQTTADCIAAIGER